MKRQQTLMSLAGKNILVIRPKALPQLGPDRFIEQLLAIGAQPLHLPVMRIDPYPVPRLDGPTSGPIEQLKATVMALANYQAVIFISRPAALLGADWIDHYWPQLPVGVQFYAVGDSTARYWQARESTPKPQPKHNQVKVCWLCRNCNSCKATKC